MKTQIEKIGNWPTIKSAMLEKADQVFAMTGFNYGIHEQDNGDGTTMLTFDCMQDAQKFMTLYNELA